MQQSILDTNFIVTCARQKIDFFEEIPLMGIQIIIPRQVTKEIKKLAEFKDSAKTREEADLALKILKRNKFKSIKLKYNEVDKGIIAFAQENPEVIIATLDKDLKKSIINRKLVIKDMKKLEVI